MHPLSPPSTAPSLDLVRTPLPFVPTVGEDSHLPSLLHMSSSNLTTKVPREALELRCSDPTQKDLIQGMSYDSNEIVLKDGFSENGDVTEGGI